MQDWLGWVRHNELPEGLPADPYKAYKGKGWIDWPDWLGRVPGGVGRNKPVRSFQEARKFARCLRLKHSREWIDLADRGELPDDLPKSAETKYKKHGWIGWGDFLGFSSRWTYRGIAAFLESIQPIIEDLSETDLFLILSKNGMLGRDQRLRHAKLLRSLTRLRTRSDVDDAARQIKSTEETLSEGKRPDDSLEHELSNEELDEPDDSRLCHIRSLEGLKAIDRIVEAHITDDEQLLDFMIHSRVAFLWNRVIEEDPEFTVDRIRALTGGEYVKRTRDHFLEQYEAAHELPLPQGYSFSKNGKLLSPNPMQWLTALRLLRDKRIGNWSGVGAGKTVAAVLSAGILDAHVTVVVAANSTLDDWEQVIRNVFPKAAVACKNWRSVRVEPSQQTFIVLNYESFQQRKWSAELVKWLSALRIDFIIMDEVQLVRQRTPSKRSFRRENIVELLDKADENPDLRVLGMSATPVVNNLHEGKKLLELVTGMKFEGLDTGTTIGNAIALHTQLSHYGIRYVPSYEELDLETRQVTLDGARLLPKLLDLTSRYVLAMEQAMLEIKLEHITKWLGPRTLIYTHYVEGMVEPLRQRIEQAGFRVAVQTGRSRSRSGLEEFKSGQADVLIGSATVGTGVDGLQYVCNRLVFVSLPWSNAEYQQIVGRLHRQESKFKKVEVIIPLVVLREEKAGVWSWDDKRLRCIEYKRTLADAVLDGAIPGGRLPSREEMHRQSLVALREWATRVQESIPLDSSEDTEGRKP